jgi:nuclear pore complex protein Nup188
MALEASSLALVSTILQKFRDAGPGAGVDVQEVQQLKWDKERVKDDIEALLEKRAVLRARIAATNEKELLMARQEPVNRSSGSENLLEEKIVKELQTVVTCLGGGEGA